MVLYTIKSLLPIKDMLKTLPFIAINKYIKMRENNALKKRLLSDFTKMGKGKIVLKKGFLSVAFIESCLSCRNIYKRLNMKYKK